MMLDNNDDEALGYGTAAGLYWDAGWRGVNPLRPATKFPPPPGRTGHGGEDPSYADLMQYCELYPDGNLMLRLPSTLIGIDVDAYDEKTGAPALAEAIKRWGPLPPTVRATSRQDGISGIRLYRIPAGTYLLDKIQFPELGIGDIEIIQNHHRYVVAWPSINKDTLLRTLWLNDTNQMVGIPKPEEQPNLPQTWFEALRVDYTAPGEDLADAEAATLIANCLTDGEQSPRVANRVYQAIVEMGTSGSRHDTVRNHVMALLRYGKDGDGGVKDALRALQNEFVKQLTSPGQRLDGNPGAAASEFRRMIFNSNAARELTKPSFDEWTKHIAPTPKSEAKPVTTDWMPDAPAPAPPPPAPMDEVDRLVAAATELLSLGQEEAAALCFDKAIQLERETTEPEPEPEDDDDTEDQTPNYFENAVQGRLTVLRVEREAKRRIIEEETPQQQPPQIKGLDSLLAEPDLPTPYRIEELHPAGGRTLLAAQYKAGKSTLTGNFIRCMVDGDPFLNRFQISELSQSIVLIDTELSENTLRLWLRQQQIQNTAAVSDVLSLRGKLGSFNICDDRNRAAWARRLQDLNTDFLVLDCLRPVLDANGLDEHSEVGVFLTAFDALLDEAGVPDALMVHHMGHSGERSRGDSRLQDWPDSIWTIVRENENPASDRFFKAYGRDVDVPEGKLIFDANNRRLTLNPGGRGDAKTEGFIVAVIDLLAYNDKNSNGPLSGRAIEKELGAQKPVRAALERLVDRGIITFGLGRYQSRLYQIANPCDLCKLPVTNGGSRHFSCPADAAGALL